MIRCGDERGSSQPRIFVSYARSDGGALAHALHRRLEQEAGFSLWQDLADLEGGAHGLLVPPDPEGLRPHRRGRARRPRRMATFYSDSPIRAVACGSGSLVFAGSADGVVHALEVRA